MGEGEKQKEMIAVFSDFKEITLQMRDILHPLFRSLKEGLSEFTFANIYLFRKAHSYKISKINEKRKI